MASSTTRITSRKPGLDPDKPPKTWDELVGGRQEAMTKNGQYGFGITGGGEVGNTIFRSLPFIWMNGGDIISADMTKAVGELSPKPLKAVKFYTELLQAGSCAELDAGERRHSPTAQALHRRHGVAYQSGQFDIPAIRRRTRTSTSAR